MDTLKPVPTVEHLLTTTQAAHYLGISPDTLATWRVRISDGPPFVRVGRAIRYRHADLAEWIAGRRRRSTSEP